MKTQTADSDHPPGAPPRCRRLEAGTILVPSVIAVFVAAGFTAIMMTTVTTAKSEVSESMDSLQRLYLAESAIHEALLSLNTGGTGSVGSATAPQQANGGTYWASTVDNGDKTYTVTARGVYSGTTRTLQAVVKESGHVFHHALFAGNSSGDPNYELLIEGNGTQADNIIGNIYSGGGIRRNGGATVTGTARANGAIHGMAGTSGVTQPSIDLASLNFPANHDVNVAAEFNANQQWKRDDAGGKAYQVPEALASHIFRKNPNDRNSANSSTTKNDYYLEDPYEPVRKDTTQTGIDPYNCTLNVSDGVVFYIDGNMWIHNVPSFSFRLTSETGDPVRVTFAVRGNVYFCDNLFYNSSTDDGVAFIALKDPAVPDSGNIYFGDPNGGTLEYMDAYMYAENNFVDNNLSASGSKAVEVHGTMSAGNQVAIQRTWGTQHSKLTVDMDERLKDGVIQLPGIPTTQQNLSWDLVAVMEVAN